jgi:hypothetical protein
MDVLDRGELNSESGSGSVSHGSNPKEEETA